MPRLPRAALAPQAILPQYATAEEAVTRPDRGVFVTRYFLERWRPILGAEAASLVTALRLLADSDGRTFAGVGTLAAAAGLSPRAVKRWLAERCPAEWRGARAEQWAALHEHFVGSKVARWRTAGPNGTEPRRTSNVVSVVMTDPPTPEDEASLGARSGRHAVASSTAPPATDRTGPVANGRATPKEPARAVDNSAHGGQSGPYGENGPKPLAADALSAVPWGPVWPSGSYSDRLIQRTLILKGGPDPDAEGLVDELGDWLKRKHGDPGLEPHRSAAAHRLAVRALGPDRIREAQRALEDRIEAGRARRLEPVRDPSATFWGIVKTMARAEGLELGGKR